MRTEAIPFLLCAAVISGFIAARAEDKPEVSAKASEDDSAYFLDDVMPLVTKIGCNLSSCHGSAQGKTSESKAKSVIQIWMNGGPTHLDTFDPKPDSGDEYCGPYKNPVQTNVPGMRLCEMLPLLAKQADKYSIIRSFTHGNESDEKGENVKNRPVYPWDLSASMYTLLGIDPNSTLPHPHGCAAHVTPPAGGDIQSGGLLTEIM